MARNSLLGAAVVADQPVVALVPGHMHAAVPALRLPAAIVAVDQRRIAAPVDKDQRLLLLFQRVLDGFKAGRTQWLAAGQGAAVLQQQGRRFGIAGAVVQFQVSIAAGAGQLQGFQGWCGTAQDHRHIQQAGTPDREVAGRIAQAVLLFQ